MDYMLTEENLSKWISIIDQNPVIHKTVVDITIPKVVVKSVTKSCIHHPGFMRDKLFWSFFIVTEGLDKYMQAKEKLFRFETDFKYSSALKIKDKTATLKALKIKSLEIESELVTSKHITMPIFHSLTIAHNKSIIYVHDLIYYDFSYGDEYFLIERKKDDVFLHTGDVTDKIIDIRKNLFNIDKTKTKHIGSISSYTAKELHSIADKLKIEKTVSNKPLTKPLLYAEIVIKIGKLT